MNLPITTENKCTIGTNFVYIRSIEITFRESTDEYRVVYSSTYRYIYCRGGSKGGAPGARPLPKIEKYMIFWRKIVIFHMKYFKNFRASLRIWKKYDFLA